MSDVLTKIADYKREDVRALKAQHSRSEIESRANATEPPRGFRAALAVAQSSGRLALIGEIKRASPSRGLIRSDFDPVALAGAYARGGATCLSILTDGPSFQGAPVHLSEARGAVELPCLRKDFLVDPWQVAESRAFGADAVLLILALADDLLAADILAEAAAWGMDVLVETHDLAEMRRAAALGARLVGINNRNLRTFVTDLATTERLAEERPPNSILVTESGIAKVTDAARMAAAGANAMLVGESLMRAADVEQAARTLLGFDACRT